MRKWIICIMIATGISALAGTVSPPKDRIAFPQVSGNHLVCIWDETANDWYTGFIKYDLSGTYTFTVPQWNRWYWVGLWNVSEGRYVFGTWLSHVKTDPE